MGYYLRECPNRVASPGTRRDLRAGLCRERVGGTTGGFFQQEGRSISGIVRRLAGGSIPGDADPGLVVADDGHSASISDGGCTRARWPRPGRLELCGDSRQMNRLHCRQSFSQRTWPIHCSSSVSDKSRSRAAISCDNVQLAWAARMMPPCRG
jgi:hypothetical protein